MRWAPAATKPKFGFARNDPRPGLAPGRFVSDAGRRGRRRLIMALSEGRGLGTALVAALLTAFIESASAGTLDHIGQDKAVRIAYPDDAPPFSYKDKIGAPAGYMVDLCRAVAKKLAEQLQLPTINVAYVPVTAADRFEAIRQQKADLLCEPTSATLSRRELVDFSIPTFLDAAALMGRAGGAHVRK